MPVSSPERIDLDALCARCAALLVRLAGDASVVLLPAPGAPCGICGGVS